MSDMISDGIFEEGAELTPLVVMVRSVPDWSNRFIVNGSVIPY